LLLRRTNDGSNVSMSFLFESLEVLVNVLSANFAFVFSFAFAAKLMLVMPRGKEILLTILISSYVKIFLFAMPVCFVIIPQNLFYNGHSFFLLTC
jgi:hypothetical protein